MYRIMLLAVLVCVGCMVTSVPSSETSVGTDCKPLGLHYVVVSNEKQSQNFRRIEVFLKTSEFNEENLLRLFSHLSKQWPDPKFLTIAVYTEWTDLNLPDGCGTGASGAPEPENVEGEWAVFSRHETTVQFRYRTKADPENVKTVVMSGTGGRIPDP